MGTPRGSDHRCFQLDLAGLHQLHHRNRRERLGDGAHVELRLGPDRDSLRLVGASPGPDPVGLAGAGDQDHSGELPRFGQLVQVALGLFERSVLGDIPQGAVLLQPDPGHPKRLDRLGLQVEDGPFARTRPQDEVPTVLVHQADLFELELPEALPHSGELLQVGLDGAHIVEGGVKGLLDEPPGRRFVTIAQDGQELVGPSLHRRSLWLGPGRRGERHRD